MSAHSNSQSTNTLKNWLSDWSDWNKWSDSNKAVFCGMGIISLIFGRSIYNRLYRKFYGLPPGPYGYPFVGCLSYMKNEKDFYKYLTNAYGSNIILFYLGMSRKIILINDAETFCKMANDKNCLYRPTGNKHKTEPINLVIANGSEWNYRRKLMHKNFSLIINNSSFMENEMKKSIQNVLISNIENILNKNKNNKFELSVYFNFISFNIIYSCLFDDHLDFKSKEYIEFSKMGALELNANQSLTIVSLIFGYNKFGKEILNIFSNEAKNALEQRRKIIFEYTFPKIQEWYNKYFDVKMNMNDNTLLITNNDKYNKSNPNSYGKLMIDEYLETHKLNVSSLIAETRVLFRAGIDGTAETSNYGIALISKPEHIKFQELVYNEMKQVCIDNNINDFSLKILNKLHLFRALIYEILRISSVARSGVSRITKKDININGYYIPKDSIIMANMPKIHIYDKKLWGNNPREINLNNWLDANKKFKYNNNFIGFGFGRRDCPGKAFAIKTLYFIFGMLIYRYIFTLNDQNIPIKQDYKRIRRLKQKIFVNIQKRNN